MKLSVDGVEQGDDALEFRVAQRRYLIVGILQVAFVQNTIQGHTDHLDTINPTFKSLQFGFGGKHLTYRSGKYDSNIKYISQNVLPVTNFQ